MVGSSMPIYLVKIKGIIDNPDLSRNDEWVAIKSEEEVKKKAQKKWNVDDISKIS